MIQKLGKANQKVLLSKNVELQQALISHQAATEHRFSQQTDLTNGIKTDIGRLTTLSKENGDRLVVLERQQDTNSAILRELVEFLRSLAIG